MGASRACMWLVRRGTVSHVFPHMAQSLEASAACDTWSALCCVHDLVAGPDASRPAAAVGAAARGLSGEQLANPSERFLVAQLEDLIGTPEASTGAMLLLLCMLQGYAVQGLVCRWYLLAQLLACQQAWAVEQNRHAWVCVRMGPGGADE